jgi:hypothetical protein
MRTKAIAFASLNYMYGLGAFYLIFLGARPVAKL